MEAVSTSSRPGQLGMAFAFEGNQYPTPLFEGEFHEDVERFRSFFPWLLELESLWRQLSEKIRGHAVAFAGHLGGLMTVFNGASVF
jgi:hypothetical protein